MIVACMRELREMTDTTLFVLFYPIDTAVVVELTGKVRRPCSMDRPAMEMSDFSMPMVCLWMDMEQRSRKHPQRCPGQDSHPTP